MAGGKKGARRSRSDAQAQPRRRLPAVPSTRERRSAGAAAARDFLKVPAPVQVFVKLDGHGGSDLEREKKDLRAGDLSAASTRFTALDCFFGQEIGADAEAADDGEGEVEVGIGGDGGGDDGGDVEVQEGEDEDINLSGGGGGGNVEEEEIGRDEAAPAEA